MFVYLIKLSYYKVYIFSLRVSTILPMQIVFKNEVNGLEKQGRSLYLTMG